MKSYPSIPSTFGSSKSDLGDLGTTRWNKEYVQRNLFRSLASELTMNGESLTINY